MDFSDLDFGQMAMETMHINESLKDFDQSEFETFIDDELNNSPIVPSEVNDPIETIVQPALISIPESSGIIYYLDKSAATFCIRGVASANVSELYSQIECGEDLELFNRFKFKDGDGIAKLAFFETTSLSNAKIIEQNIINRRFPYEEDLMCNLSDPGFSWWMEHGDNYLKIFYKSYGIERAQKLIKLGPLDSCSDLKRSISRFRPILDKMFPVDEFFSDEKALVLSIAHEKDDNFELFKEIFVSGFNPFRAEQFCRDSLMADFYQTFSALSDIRSFWLQIENDFDKKNSVII